MWVAKSLTIPFDAIREVEVTQLLRFDVEMGAARPALVLESGGKCLLSTTKRSPRRCREIIEHARSLLAAAKPNA